MLLRHRQECRQGACAGQLRLELAICSGEPVRRSMLRRMQALCRPTGRVLNLYGATEAAADSTCWDATAATQADAGADYCKCLG